MEEYLVTKIDRLKQEMGDLKFDKRGLINENIHLMEEIEMRENSLADFDVKKREMVALFEDIRSSISLDRMEMWKLREEVAFLRKEKIWTLKRRMDEVDLYNDSIAGRVKRRKLK